MHDFLPPPPPIPIPFPSNLLHLTFSAKTQISILVPPTHTIFFYFFSKKLECLTPPSPPFPPFVEYQIFNKTSFTSSSDFTFSVSVSANGTPLSTRLPLPCPPIPPRHKATVSFPELSALPPAKEIFADFFAEVGAATRWCDKGWVATWQQLRVPPGIVTATPKVSSST